MDASSPVELLPQRLGELAKQSPDQLLPLPSTVYERGGGGALPAAIAPASVLPALAGKVPPPPYNTY